LKNYNDEIMTELKNPGKKFFELLEEREPLQNCRLYKCLLRRDG